MANVFDDAEKRKFPVNIMLNGKKTTVGQAEIIPGADGVMHVQMDLKSNNIQNVAELLNNGLVDGYSVDGSVGPSHRMTETEIQAAKGIVRHSHEPRQHRDGKPPWCKACGLTADYETPKSNIDHFGFGRPANPLRGEH